MLLTVFISALVVQIKINHLPALLSPIPHPRFDFDDVMLPILSVSGNEMSWRTKYGRLPVMPFLFNWY